MNRTDFLNQHHFLAIASLMSINIKVYDVITIYDEIVNFGAIYMKKKFYNKESSFKIYL